MSLTAAYRNTISETRLAKHRRDGRNWWTPMAHTINGGWESVGTPQDWHGAQRQLTQYRLVLALQGRGLSYGDAVRAVGMFDPGKALTGVHRLQSIEQHWELQHGRAWD